MKNLVIKGDLHFITPPQYLGNVIIYCNVDDIEDAIILDGDVTLSTNPSCNIYVTGDLIVEGL